MLVYCNILQVPTIVIFRKILKYSAITNNDYVISIKNF